MSLIHKLKLHKNYMKIIKLCKPIKNRQSAIQVSKYKMSIQTASFLMCGGCGSTAFRIYLAADKTFTASYKSNWMGMPAPVTIEYQGFYRVEDDNLRYLFFVEHMTRDGETSCQQVYDSGLGRQATCFGFELHVLQKEFSFQEMEEERECVAMANGGHTNKTYNAILRIYKYCLSKEVEDKFGLHENIFKMIFV